MAGSVDVNITQLAEKINGLELTEEEGIAMATIFDRAGQADGEDVAGFGWDEGVAAFKVGALQPAHLAHAIGGRGEMRHEGNHIYYPCGLP